MKYKCGHDATPENWFIEIFGEPEIDLQGDCYDCKNNAATLPPIKPCGSDCPEYAGNCDCLCI